MSEESDVTPDKMIIEVIVCNNFFVNFAFAPKGILWVRFGIVPGSQFQLVPIKHVLVQK